MSCRVGLDLGSSYTKGVLVDESNRILEYHLVKTGFDFRRAAGKVIEKFSSVKEFSYPVYTCGYGRDQLEIPFVSNSEIIALSKAVFQKYSSECSVIDIGGQDTKYIQINRQGQVDKFKMNRKCAAGTGSFLEEIAFRLDISASEFNEYAGLSTEDFKINSFCTVFAISEIIGMIKKGVSIQNIAVGIYNSIIDRCSEMAATNGTLILTGGVPDQHPEIVNLFRKRYNKIENPEKSQFYAAYGCILLNT